jgi:TetR/AcrR family transcriptional regulator, regulator of autoinduction and epiphytic fitness
MSSPAKRRAYDSPLRREQAAATRTRMLAAAQSLFEERGYAATSIAAIAAEAGVSQRTVYLAFETKAELLRALWNARLRGADDAPPVAQLARYKEVLDEPDPARQLELNAHHAVAVKRRIGALHEVIRAGAPVDPDVGALWDRIQTEFRENQRAIVASIADKGALRDGLEVERAADILWTINHGDLWQHLVVRRGWTPEEFERWLAETFRTLLLG